MIEKQSNGDEKNGQNWVQRTWNHMYRNFLRSPRNQELFIQCHFTTQIHLLVLYMLNAIGRHASYRAVIPLKGKKIDCIDLAFVKGYNKRRCKILQLVRFSLTELIDVHVLLNGPKKWNMDPKFDQHFTGSAIFTELGVELSLSLSWVWVEFELRFELTLS